MRIPTALLIIAFVMAPSPIDQTLGAGVKLAEATPIADLYKNPEQFVGKTVRLDGLVTAVCQEMGNEAAKEQLAAQPTASDFGKTYQVKVTGAILK